MLLFDGIRKIFESPKKYDYAVTIAHDIRNVIGIWWYNTKTAHLDYSTDAKSHFEYDKFPYAEDTQWEKAGWIRGRIFKYNGKNFVLFYTDDYPTPRSIPTSFLEDLFSKLKTVSGVELFTIVDGAGTDLLHK